MFMKKLATLDNLFLLTVFCIPLYLIKVSIFGLPTNILELLAIFTILLLLLRNKKQLPKKLLSIPKIFLLSFTLIVLGLLFSIFFNNSKLVGFGILKGWFIVPILFSFALFSAINSNLTTEKIFKSIYFSIVTVALVALWYKLFGIVTFDNRLSAFYLSPNHLAMYLSPGIFFGLYFLLKSFFASHFSKQTIFYFFTLSSILFAIYYTYSYGAWIALFLSLLIIISTTTSFKKYAPSLVLFLFLFFTILFTIQTNTEKFSSLVNFSDRSSAFSRQTIWQASALLIQKSPLVGIGPGNFQDSYLALQPFFPPYLEWAVPQPHNIFLAFWLQSGLIGFTGFIMLLFFIFKTLRQLLKNKKSAALATPLYGFFLYTVLHGLIDTTYWKNDLAFLFWICTFLLLALQQCFQKINTKATINK